MATANLLQTSVSGGTQNALSLQGDGVFFPKASTTSRLALTLGTTDKGFIVYDTTDNNIYFWNGTAWESVPSSGDAGTNGSVQYNDNGIVSGASNFTYNKATSAVAITGQLSTADVLKATGNPGLSAAGATEAFVAHNTSYGAILYGQGTTYDAALLDRNTGLRLTVTTSGAQVSGDLTVSTGNVVMATSGKGIDFSATASGSGTMTSELLNDYEEGTWTPVLGGFGGTSGQTYSLQVGRYTKVGRQVICSFEATLTAVGTVTGDAIVSGLPFSSVSTSNNTDGGTTTIGFANNLATNQIFITGYLNGTGAYSFITGTAAAGTLIGNITATNIFGNTTRLSGTITYTAS